MGGGGGGGCRVSGRSWVSGRPQAPAPPRQPLCPAGHPPPPGPLAPSLTRVQCWGLWTPLRRSPRPHGVGGWVALWPPRPGRRRTRSHREAALLVREAGLLRPPAAQMGRWPGVDGASVGLVRRLSVWRLHNVGTLRRASKGGRGPFLGLHPVGRAPPPAEGACVCGSCVINLGGQGWGLPTGLTSCGLGSRACCSSAAALGALEWKDVSPPRRPVTPAVI